MPSRLSLSIGATLSILNLETETALNSGETHVQGNIDVPPVIWSVYDTTRGNGVGANRDFRRWWRREPCEVGQ